MCVDLTPNTASARKKANISHRSLAMWSKLPFGISDSDIDVEVRCLLGYILTLSDHPQIPIDIDDTCTDQHKILQTQQLQKTATGSQDGKPITTVLPLSQSV